MTSDVEHNDDRICKILSPVFCFLFGTPASGNNILYTKWYQNDKDVQFIDGRKRYRATAG